ncbi:hypothetical protein RQP46_002511 [Phenoliferia psychrophenolica]
MIVQMVSDQEDAWEDRVTDPRERAGHINCLRALALVNKELSELTARHRFRVLFAGRAELREHSEYFDYEETYFETVILPRHAHHMQKIVFKDTDELESAQGAIEIMGGLPALRSLDFEAGRASNMFDGYHFDMFWQRDGTITRNDCRNHGILALKIETLVLRGFEPLNASMLAQAFTNLRSLTLVALGDSDFYMDDMTDVKELAKGIATLRQLEILSIQLDAWADKWSLEGLAALLLDPPPIKTLHLLWFPLQSIPLVTNIFTSSLETLCIHLRDQDDISPEELEELSPLASLTPVQLPFLTSLTISSDNSSDLDDISRLLLPSSSSLTQLVCNLTDISLDAADESSAPLLRLLDSQPSLRHVKLGRHPTYPSQDILTLSFVAAYTTLVHSRNLDPSVLDDPSTREPTSDAGPCDRAAGTAGHFFIS